MKRQRIEREIERAKRDLERVRFERTDMRIALQTAFGNAGLGLFIILSACSDDLSRRMAGNGPLGVEAAAALVIVFVTVPSFAAFLFYRRKAIAARWENVRQARQRLESLEKGPGRMRAAAGAARRRSGAEGVKYPARSA